MSVFYNEKLIIIEFLNINRYIRILNIIAFFLKNSYILNLIEYLLFLHNVFFNHEVKMPDYILEIKNLSKDFHSIKSLDNINISIDKSEIHSIVGIKGAGKSTLVKILGGYYPSNSYIGEIILKGKIQQFNSPGDSENAGISIAYQDHNLIDQMTVYENIFLGKEIIKLGIINWQKECAIATQLLHSVGLVIRNDLKLFNLSFGEQQLVKIAKAIYKNKEILIFDEPAVGLTEMELEKFLLILKKLKNDGITCIYLSHELKEVLNVSDRITILNDGKVICTEKNEDLNEDWVLNTMSGRKLERTKSIDSLLKEYGITEREKEIVLSLIRGYSNKEISDKLFISVNTVKTHIAKIYQKLGVSQRIDLANLFRDPQIL